jgi:hypothetical protein
MILMCITIMYHSLGNVYGKQSDPRFNLPRGMIMDDKRKSPQQNFKNNEPNYIII